MEQHCILKKFQVVNDTIVMMVSLMMTLTILYFLLFKGKEPLIETIHV
jgi:hypothetical protein